MYRLDSQGRLRGGLFEACGATNSLMKNSRLDAQIITSSQPEPGSPKPKSEDENSERRRKKVVKGKNLNVSVSNTNMGVNIASAFQIQPPPTPSQKKSKTELYCLCKSPWDDKSGVILIACDGNCKDWFHPECLGFQKSEKKGVVLIDADGTKVDVQTKQFRCPWCELTNQIEDVDFDKQLSPTSIAKWCEITEFSEEEEETNPVPLSIIRLRLLMKARSSVKELQTCINCKKKHHPMISCPSRPVPVALIEDSSIHSPMKMSNQVSELHALVVGGKYVTYRGKIIQSSKKWSLLLLDDGYSTICIPNHHLLVSSIKFNKSEEGIQKNMIGITTDENGHYDAWLDLDETTKIHLGKFQSYVRAARVHDFAVRLQFGDEDPNLLNFPEIQISRVLQNHKTTNLFEASAALLSQVYIGPFSQGNQLSDCFRAQDWCEMLLNEVDELPPYHPESQRILSSLLKAIDPIAVQESIKLKNFLEKNEDILKLSDAESHGGNEEYLDTIMKKFVRSRNSKQRKSAV